MNTWAPLWNGIVDSSIWDEPDYVIKVFVTMMALKDADHVVRLTAYQIGKRSKKDEREVLDALKILSSPDTKRLEKQAHDGRRIMAVEEGWLILNGEKYRAMVSLEMKRARNRRAQKAWRERQKSKPLPGENVAVAAESRGDMATVDAIHKEVAERNGPAKNSGLNPMKGAVVPYVTGQ